MGWAEEGMSQQFGVVRQWVDVGSVFLSWRSGRPW